MGRHLAFPEVSNAQFLKIAAANIEALTTRSANIPADRMRLHSAGATTRGRTIGHPAARAACRSR